MADPNPTDDERAALMRENIAPDQYSLSPRIRRMKSLLAKLEPSAVAAPATEPLPPPKAWPNSTSRHRNPPARKTIATAAAIAVTERNQVQCAVCAVTLH